jgi:hypothetical protein
LIKILDHSLVVTRISKRILASTRVSPGRPPKYKKHDNLIFDYQAFRIQGLLIVEKGPEITLPNGKTFPAGESIRYEQVVVL